ncbi:MAG: polysaccharide biosynthesis protein [Deltaproteobacteria bacterium]|nr:polysaccharide biosynthesis protein [Deltaproteobacteria bacterium]
MSIAYWVAFMFRFEFDPSFDVYKLLLFTWPYVVVLKYLMLVAFGVPKFSWRYVGLQEATQILYALSAATAVLVIFRLSLAPLGGYFKFVVIPLGVLGMDFVLSYMGVTGARVLRRTMAERAERSTLKGPATARKRTLLIGAGRAGVMVAKEVTQNPHIGIKVVGYVDDAAIKIGTIIQGHKVLGDTASMEALVKEHSVEQAIITIASASGQDIRRVVGLCESISLPVRIIPGIYEILDGRVNLSRIREVTIEDLLGREAVELDLGAIGAFIKGKRVLVTGAGGSIGSELCRQVGRFEPDQLLLVEQSENVLFEIHGELLRKMPDLATVPCIADVCDYDRVEKVFTEYRPHVVFHAAAHKHVPMMEWNPGEAIKNNVFGTKQVADAADRHGAEAFVLISTDKAVNPTSIMGTSKRVAEIYCQSLSLKSATTFVGVRFGNVLGSAGSVIPIFKKQIRSGGPVTVTHPDMQRYFMTIPEACQLVMQAATMGEGSEIFVLDMGEPVKIVDLARDLIRLSGFTEEEIPVEFSGIRPGEKLFEELSTEGEDMGKTRHPKIFIGKIETHPIDQVEIGLTALKAVTDGASRDDVRAALERVVPEMREPDREDTSRISDRPPAPSEMIH